MEPAATQSAAAETNVRVAAPAAVAVKSNQEPRQRDQAHQQLQQHPQQVQQQLQVQVHEIGACSSWNLKASMQLKHDHRLRQATQSSNSSSSSSTISSSRNPC